MNLIEGKAYPSKPYFFYFNQVNAAAITAVGKRLGDNAYEDKKRKVYQLTADPGNGHRTDVRDDSDCFFGNCGIDSGCPY